MEKSERNKTLSLSDERIAALIAEIPKAEDDLSGFSDGIICGDAFIAAKKLKDKSFDLMIADPPYNLNKNFHGYGFHRTDGDKYAEYTYKWVEAFGRLLKDDASLYVCCDWRSSIDIAPVLAKFFTIRNRITWQREKGRGASANWKNSHEDIWFCTVGDKYKFNTSAVMMRRKVIAPYRAEGKPKDWEEIDGVKMRDTYPSNFWDDITVPYWSMSENTDHPTQKPEKLLAKLILASTNEGDSIFDPFAGSGSTLSAAKKLNRKCVGTEMNSAYCAWAKQRILNAETDKTIQGYEDGVFYERNTKIKKK